MVRAKRNPDTRREDRVELAMRCRCRERRKSGKVAGDPEKGFEGAGTDSRPTSNVCPTARVSLSYAQTKAAMCSMWAKARSLKKTLSPVNAQGRGHTNRIESMIRLTTADGIRLHAHGDRGPAAGKSNLIKRLRPRFNVLNARRQVVFPISLLTEDHEASRNLQAPWRAVAQRILFRSLRPPPRRSTGRSIPCNGPSC